jgi:hypothetical protein
MDGSIVQYGEPGRGRWRWAQSSSEGDDVKEEHGKVRNESGKYGLATE